MDNINLKEKAVLKIIEKILDDYFKTHKPINNQAEQSV